MVKVGSKLVSGGCSGLANERSRLVQARLWLCCLPKSFTGTVLCCTAIHCTAKFFNHNEYSTVKRETLSPRFKGQLPRNIPNNQPLLLILLITSPTHTLNHKPASLDRQPPV